MDEAMIGDAGAVAVVIDPASCVSKMRRMHVAMEMRGQHTRGMTVVDPRYRYEACCFSPVLVLLL